MESVNIYVCSLVKKALHCYSTTLSQLQINPVKVSQLLFSERFISETLLDEMETLEGSLDEKKTTLLSAIHTAVSSDHTKLKVLATVLSTFHEAHVLSERISDEYGENLFSTNLLYNYHLLSSKVSR